MHDSLQFAGVPVLSQQACDSYARGRRPCQERLLKGEQTTRCLCKRAPATKTRRGWQAHLQRIVPEAEIEAVTAMFGPDTADALLSGSPDYVLDAIDQLNTKARL